ncbi:MAG TPA: ABC transporter substrate-binding protein [Solirubrobacterales bacterium]|nr:ABC transporter substrate-binding protein [Solirubrobacterales bacterium]
MAAIIVGILLTVGISACGSSGSSASGGSSSAEAEPKSEAGGGESGSSTESVRLDLIPAFGSLPLHVAEVNGFFEKQGLDVSTTESTDVAGGVAALGKQFDIALGSPSIMFAANVHGAGLEAVSGLQVVDKSHVNTVLVSKEPVKSLKELEGKSVAEISLSGGSIQATKYVIQSEGGDPSAVHFSAVPLPTMADQVKAGRIDAAVSAVPFFTGLEGVSVDEKDISVTAVEAITKGKQKSTQSAIMIATKGFVEEHPEAAEKFRAALAEAIAWIEENPKKATELLSGWLGLEEAIVEAAPTPAFSATISTETLQPLIEIAQAVGELPSSAPSASEQLAPGADEEPR